MFDASQILLLKSHTKFPIEISGFVVAWASVFDSLLLAFLLFIVLGPRVHFVVETNSKSLFVCSFTMRDTRVSARMIESHVSPRIPEPLGFQSHSVRSQCFKRADVVQLPWLYLPVPKTQTEQICPADRSQESLRAQRDNKWHLKMDVVLKCLKSTVVKLQNKAMHHHLIDQPARDLIL